MKKYSLKQLFSLVDGRLSTKMEDVYDMLNHICNESLYTHHLPVAMRFIKELPTQPDWWPKVEAEIATASQAVGSNEFQPLMDYIDQHNTTYEIPQLTAEQLENFWPFMMDNSLLKNLGSNHR